MRISDEDIDQIRERNDLVEIVSQHVTLKKSGRSFKGLCPFHREKTPSFMVNPVKQLYHCFGCGEGGNAFTFAMKTDNLSFPEAVRMLADRVGYRLRWEEEEGEVSERKRICDAHRFAMNFYHDYLIKQKDAAVAREYLKNRGFNETTIRTFRLGYAPKKWDALTVYLQRKGFKLTELALAGLAGRGEQGPSYYDRFRNRIIFPILDVRGRDVLPSEAVSLMKATPNILILRKLLFSAKVTSFMVYFTPRVK